MMFAATEDFPGAVVQSVQNERYPARAAGVQMAFSACSYLRTTASPSSAL